jgi:inositol 1,4,5-triphosphate receptor type 1
LSPQPYSDSGGDDAEALTKVRNEHFTDMKKWLLDTVKKNTQLDCSESSIKENEMIVKVLDVLGHLVRFGYYDSEEDIDEMIGPLIDLLDDQGEKKDDKTNDKKSNDSNGNKAMFEVKLKALEVMDLFFTFKFYVTLQKFMNDFKILEGTGRMVIGGNGSRDGPPTTLRSLLHEIDPTKCEDWIYSIEMTQAVQNRLEQLSSSAIKGHSHPNLEKVLLDLSQYECDELITASLELLTKMYFFEEELFDKAIQSQLLVNPDSIHDYGIVNDEILPDLRQLMRVDPDQEKQQILMNKLDQLMEMLRLSDNMDELNKENQIMLNNFGLVDDILSYLLTKTESNTESLDSGVALQPAVFQKCFDLLRVCTTDYRDIQIRLFNRIDLLLSFKVPTIALANLADLLTEIFTGGYEIVLKVKESHINRIFEIVINCPNLHVQAQFMMTLEAITRSEDYDYPIRKNQVLIIKNFCLFRDKFCESLLSGEAADHRFEILTQDNDTAELRLLLHLTDMLAACAEGKDLFIESVCQNIFTIEELVKIISTPLPSTRKRPFVRFLIQIYLKADIESSSSGGVTITHGPLMWDYLMQVADLLGSITTALNIAAYDHEKMIKMDKKSAFRNRSKSVTHKTQSRTSSALTIPSVTNDDGTLEAGLLEYLIEGILPLLNNFYLNYFSPKDIINDQQKEMQYNVSAKIVRNLITLKEIILKFLTSQQISVFRDTVMSLCGHEEICRLANINTQVETASITSVRRQAFGSGTKHSQRPNQSITTQHTHTTGNEVL